MDFQFDNGHRLVILEFNNLFLTACGKKILTIPNSPTYVSVVVVQPYEIKTHVNLF